MNQMERWAPKAKEFRDLIDFALVTNSGSVMLEVCANGGGIALLPTCAQPGQEHRSADLARDRADPFWLTYTERVRRLARAQIVIDWLRGLFNQQRTPWFRPNFIHPLTMESREIGIDKLDVL